MTKIYTLLWGVLICNMSFGQITVSRNFNLELADRDSVKSSLLEHSLNAFLTEAQSGEFSATYVDTAHIKKYEFFFNKLRGYGTNRPGRTFDDPIVIKSYSDNEDGVDYFITVSLSGVQDDKHFIYRIVELKAVPYDGHYRFFSPFEDRTANFETQTFGTVTYHSSGSLDQERAAEFAELKDEIARLSGNEPKPLDYYKFESLDELLKAYGLVYSASNCNFLCYDLGFTDNDGQMYMTGTDKEDYIYGYFGDFLYYNLPNREEIYWPFVNGVSTYFGGYGLSFHSIEELKRQFREEMDKNPEINFLEEYKKERKSSVYRHFSFYVMNSFLCQEAMDKHGFAEVLELIYSGAEGELFFARLKEILGVDESNFHETIVGLIQ